VIVKASVAGAAASGMDGEAAIAAILQDVPVPR
jgi:hypothetical protein